jgi:hypothetical protein
MTYGPVVRMIRGCCRRAGWRRWTADRDTAARTVGAGLFVTWVPAVDAGCKTTVVDHGAGLGIDVEVVTKDPQAEGFSVIKRRRVIERTFGWIMLHRRLARDDEALPDTSAAMIRIAMIDNLARRVTDESTPPGETPKATSLTKHVNELIGGGRCAQRTPLHVSGWETAIRFVVPSRLLLTAV